MFTLGEIQELEVQKILDFGIYLSEPGLPDERVLLPKKQVPEGTTIGSKMEVFLYKDSEDRLIATTTTPKLTMGKLAALKVVSVSTIGAFLDWGLEKDLFLPFKEQEVKVSEGDEILIRLYADKSARLCGTMKKLYDHLKQDSQYKKDDLVSGRVYEFSKNFGAFVAVDDCYSALIPIHEDHSQLKIGQVIQAKVVEVKPDGKLTLTMRERAHLQMDIDVENVLGLIQSNGGKLPFNDKATSELIMDETGLSKNAFKRAVGRLYKERKIEITENGIILKDVK